MIKTVIPDQGRNLLTQLSVGRDQQVGDWDLMCASDKEQLGIWNTSTPPTLDACVQDLVENINFIPPSSGLTLSFDGLFPLPKRVRDELGYQTQPFILGGELHHGSARMNMRWDEVNRSTKHSTLVG